MRLLLLKAIPQAELLRARAQRPTEAQAEAGNYFKPRIQWQGLEIAIENPAGTVREGKGWKITMRNHYGYVVGTEGVDGDEVDVYLGPDLETAPTVYVVHQRKAGNWKAYDEDKVMIGFASEAKAREAYLKHYDDPRFLGPITAMPVAQFVEKVKATSERPAMIKADENLGELIKEHKRLVAVLRSPSHEDDEEEAEKQSAELAAYRREASARGSTDGGGRDA